MGMPTQCGYQTKKQTNIVIIRDKIAILGKKLSLLNFHTRLNQNATSIQSNGTAGV